MLLWWQNTTQQRQQTKASQRIINILSILEQSGQTSAAIGTVWCLYSETERSFKFTTTTSCCVAAVMEYGWILLLQYTAYKNDIINHYREGNGSTTLQTLLSCEQQPFLLSLNSIVLSRALLFITCLIYCSAVSVHISLCKWSSCNKGYWNKSIRSWRISDAEES